MHIHKIFHYCDQNLLYFHYLWSQQLIFPAVDNFSWDFSLSVVKTVSFNCAMIIYFTVVEHFCLRCWDISLSVVYDFSCSCWDIFLSVVNNFVLFAEIFFSVKLNSHSAYWYIFLIAGYLSVLTAEIFLSV